MKVMAREGENVTIVSHCAGTGKRTQLARKFKVSDVQPYAQHSQSVSLYFVEPRKRSWRSAAVIPDNCCFYTVERDGQVIYDSRADVPCDMDSFKQALRRHKAQHEQHCRQE